MEIDDQGEFEFVSKTLNDAGLAGGQNAIPIGASKVNGTWRFMTSHHDVTYFHWGPGQPNCPCKRCWFMGLADFNITGWGVGDILPEFWSYIYVCEIPL